MGICSIPISVLHRCKRSTNWLRMLPPLSDAATRIFLSLKKGSSITEVGSLESVGLVMLGLKATSCADVLILRTACAVIV